MNGRERLIASLMLEEVDRVPVVSHLQAATVDLMEITGCYWPEANQDASQMATLALAANRVAGLESVKVPFDVALDPTAFGAGIGNEAIDRLPSVLEPVIYSADDVDKLEIPNPYTDGRVPIALEALQILDSMSLTIPIFGGIIAPFMLAGQIRGEENAIMDTVLDPDMMKKLLSKCTEWAILYVEAQSKAGVDVISLIDATASGTILSPEMYEELALPFQRKIINVAHSMDLPVILHICGDTMANFEMMISTGADGISVDQVMDMNWVKGQTTGKCAAVGNVSPTTTLLFHTPEDVERSCRTIIDAGTDILAPGCGIAPRTPLANMQAMARSIL
ncbi:MAG: MtaA/CmuA family methyltransferase [Euryarchaeota archaeon]|nr:MtaA/CmuA family methyltransferase [Euryarchaeota archaeon]